MSSRQSPYRALLGIALIGGLLAVGFSLFGLYTIVTGGSTNDGTETDVVGTFACEEFEGDPEIAHATDYEVERRLLGGTEVSSFNATSTDDGFRAEVTTVGRLLEASASRADGTNLTVRVVDGENRLVVEQTGMRPFRLWIDTIGSGSTITRTRLEVCP